MNMSAFLNVIAKAKEICKEILSPSFKENADVSILMEFRGLLLPNVLSQFIDHRK